MRVTIKIPRLNCSNHDNFLEDLERVIRASSLRPEYALAQLAINMLHLEEVGNLEYADAEKAGRKLEKLIKHADLTTLQE